MASRKKSSGRSTKLVSLKPRTVRMSVATRIRGGLEMGSTGKNGKSAR